MLSFSPDLLSPLTSLLLHIRVTLTLSVFVFRKEWVVSDMHSYWSYWHYSETDMFRPDSIRFEFDLFSNIRLGVCDSECVMIYPYL